MPQSHPSGLWAWAELHNQLSWSAWSGSRSSASMDVDVLAWVVRALGHVHIQYTHQALRLEGRSLQGQTTNLAMPGVGEVQG